MWLLSNFLLHVCSCFLDFSIFLLLLIFLCILCFLISLHLFFSFRFAVLLLFSLLFTLSFLLSLCFSKAAYSVSGSWRHRGSRGTQAPLSLSLSLVASFSSFRGSPATPGSAASVIPPESPKSAAGTPRRWLERVILVVLFFQSLPKVHEHGSVWNMS